MLGRFTLMSVLVSWVVVPPAPGPARKYQPATTRTRITRIATMAAPLPPPPRSTMTVRLSSDMIHLRLLPPRTGDGWVFPHGAQTAVPPAAPLPAVTYRYRAKDGCRLAIRPSLAVRARRGSAKGLASLADWVAGAMRGVWRIGHGSLLGLADRRIEGDRL